MSFIFIYCRDAGDGEVCRIAALGHAVIEGGRDNGCEDIIEAADHCGHNIKNVGGFVVFEVCDDVLYLFMIGVFESEWVGVQVMLWWSGIDGFSCTLCMFGGRW
eukprot:Lithocolla_globosa_v1_NODE_5025_length_1317_cov_8.157686.p4 type:complete len:104 gc:universal NODE_5025_length_1317_cov_8.157686:408-97(-)